MIIKIDFESEEAIYIQLRNQIIMGIATDRIREGDSLPSVRQLAENIGINMHTVNKAYAVLKQEGYINFLFFWQEVSVKMSPERKFMLWWMRFMTTTPAAARVKWRDCHVM